MAAFRPGWSKTAKRFFEVEYTNRISPHEFAGLSPDLVNWHHPSVSLPS